MRGSSRSSSRPLDGSSLSRPLGIVGGGDWDLPRCLGGAEASGARCGLDLNAVAHGLPSGSDRPPHELPSDHADRSKQHVGHVGESRRQKHLAKLNPDQRCRCGKRDGQPLQLPIPRFAARPPGNAREQSEWNGHQEVQQSFVNGLQRAEDVGRVPIIEDERYQRCASQSPVDDVRRQLEIERMPGLPDE